MSDPLAARKLANIRANPKVALHLADDGNGGDIVTVEGTAEWTDGWPDDVESTLLIKYDDAIRMAIGTTFRATADRLPRDHSHLPDSDENLVIARRSGGHSQPPAT